MDSHALTLGVTGFAQSLTERGQGHLRVGRSDTEVADHWRSRLLRVHCERPYSRRAADCRNELSPLHVCPGSEPISYRLKQSSDRCASFAPRVDALRAGL